MRMRIATAYTNTSCIVPDSTAEKEKRLIVATAGYLDTPVGETIPRSEVLQQAYANGYSDREAAQIVSDGPCEVPERGRAFGDLWATDDRESDTEPLDDEADDYYGIQTAIASDSGLIENSHYTDGDTPVTAHEAVGRYIGSRKGEETSKEKHGFLNTLHNRALRRYGKLLRGDRTLVDDYESPVVTLLSLRVSPAIDSRVDLLHDVQTALRGVIKKLRYQLTRSANGPEIDSEDYQYVSVIAGTENNRATPHVHVIVYCDRVRAACDIDESTFEPLVDRWVESAEYAADRGHRTDSGTIRVSGNNPDGDDENIPLATEHSSGNTQAALYVATQIPHLCRLSAPFHDLLHSAVCDATQTAGFNTSRDWPAQIGNNPDGDDENVISPFEISVEL